MIDPFCEQLLTLTKAARNIPSRTGHGLNPSTVWRWAKVGVRGVRLETVLVGGIRYTSREALTRFFARSTAASQGNSRNESSTRDASHGLQPGQLPAATGPAETGTALVADDAAGEADQDRSEGHTALELRVLSVGRGGRDAQLVCRDPRPHRAVGDSTAGSRVRNAGLGTR